jgi:hypothetical protein
LPIPDPSSPSACRACQSPVPRSPHPRDIKTDTARRLCPTPRSIVSVWEACADMKATTPSRTSLSQQRPLVRAITSRNRQGCRHGSLRTARLVRRYRLQSRKPEPQEAKRIPAGLEDRITQSDAVATEDKTRMGTSDSMLTRLPDARVDAEWNISDLRSQLSALSVKSSFIGSRLAASQSKATVLRTRLVEKKTTVKALNGAGRSPRKTWRSRNDSLLSALMGPPGRFKRRARPR